MAGNVYSFLVVFMCNSISRRQFTYLTGAVCAHLALPAYAQDKAAIKTLHGKLDIDGFKAKQTGRIQSQAQQTVFAIGEDAFLADGAFEADMTLDEKGLVKKVAVLSGQVLSVLKPASSRNTDLLLPNATGSIRGTGFFVNINAVEAHNYICCCYGHIAFQDSPTGEKQEFKNSYHNAVSIDENGQFQKAPFSVPFGHYDDELVMLEAQVGRTPHWELPDGKMHFLSPNGVPIKS